MRGLPGTWLSAVFAAVWTGRRGPRDSTPAAGTDAEPASRPASHSGPPGEVEIGRVSDGFILRGRTTPLTVRPGAERTEFLAAAASALEVAVASLDLDAPLIERYGADELQVYECIQRAEDIWRVQLLPPRIPVAAFAAALAPFGSLATIVGAAEAATRSGRSG